MARVNLPRVRELFLAACDLSPVDREVLLDRECAGDSALRSSVELLLRHDPSSRGWASGDTVMPPDVLQAIEAIASSNQPPPTVPERIGPYRIIAVLGACGMGIVYRARQDQLDRDIAIKVLHPGLVTARLLRRIDLEARALARLQHPNVARIFDVGTFDAFGASLPYLAMELVDGWPITDFASRNALQRTERLRLLTCACDAVEHAHQRGVIHRDLKPVNVLCDAQGHVKVLDFGIAKLLDHPDGAGLTESGQLLGTPRYMSPEQARGDGDGVDTRTDVYSLGLIGFEMIAGALPYELDDRRGPAALRTVCETRPRRLSAFERSCRGDLDTIFERALEKEPQRRYPSVAELRRDVERHLSHEPISARRASLWYRLRKFVRRKPAAAALSAAVALLLLAGGLSEVQRRHGARAKELLFGDEAIIGRAVRELPYGTVDELLPKLEKSYLAKRELWGARDQRVVAAFDNWRSALVERGYFEEAKELVMPELEVRRSQLGPEHPSTLAAAAELGGVLIMTGDPAGARRLLEEVVAASRRVLGPSDRATLRAHGDLALAIGAPGGTQDKKNAEAEYRRILALQTEAFGPADRDTIRTTAMLADVLRQRGAQDEALGRAEEALDLARTHLVEDDVVLAACLHTLGSVMFTSKDPTKVDSAVEAFREAAAIRGRRLGPGHPETTRSRVNLAGVLVHLRRFDEASEMMRAALDSAESRPSRNEDAIVKLHLNLATVLTLSGRYEEALEANQALLDKMRSRPPPDQNDVFICLVNVGCLRLKLGRYDDAELVLKEALGHPLVAAAPRHSHTLVVKAGLADVRRQRKEYREALGEFAALTKDAELGAPDDHDLAANIELGRGRCLAALGECNEARRALEESIRRFKLLPGADADISRDVQEAEEELDDLERRRRRGECGDDE